MRSTIAILLVTVIPTVFFRGIFDAFDLTKFTILMLICAMLVGFEVFESSISAYKSKRILFVLLGALSVSLVASALASGRVEGSFVGQYQRYTGVYTGFACLLTVSFVSRSSEIEVRRISLWMTIAGTICAAYAYIQVLGGDPFQWASGSFGELITGTLGNPNTSAGFVGLTVPFALALSENNKSHIRYLYAAVAGFLSGSLVLFSSALVLLTLIGVIIFVVKTTWSQLSVGRLIWSSMWIGLCLFPFFPEIRAWSPLLSAGAAFVGCFLATSRSNFLRSVPLRRGVVFGVGFATSVVAITLFWARLVDFLEDGLSERQFFFGAATRIFLDNPVFGSGPESFGLFFNEFRSAESAQLFENSISSSAHNYYLGVFSNGGLIVGAVFLALIAATMWRSIRRIWSEKNLDMHYLGAFCAALGFVFQMLVQVEHVVLVTIASVVCGLLWVSAPGSSDGVKFSRRRISHGPRASTRKTGIAVTAAVLSLVLAFAFGAKSFRADQAYRASFDPAASYEQRISSLETARKLAPWEATYQFALLQTLASAEDYATAGTLAFQAAEDSNYINTVMPSLVSVVLNSGDVNLAANLAMKALEKNPFAIQMNTAILEISNSIIDTYGPQLPSESLALWEGVQARAEDQITSR